MQSITVKYDFDATKEKYQIIINISFHTMIINNVSQSDTGK